ncbi:hypothetical protein BYT27DRAFT_7335353 [Phlegmacium glaucopus]|nr:hypothetical protein BYT27DRAFT_7335353 [Phlegmacium glaucopus]
MGGNKKEHSEELLVQKDREIAALETQVQAYIAKTSILQTRLLSTLDTLDVIQSGQNKELDAMAQTNRRLKDKLHWYNAAVKTAELERDDMRDAVLRLVEKVELSNDFSMWPHSQIHLSSLTGGSICRSPVVQASESELLLHATTMTETLRRERDFERKAHAQTRDSAQARIVSLEAQVSRREVELESCIAGAAHTVSTIEHGHPRDADQLIDEPLTREQVIYATVARNKMLDIEIKGLFKRLEDARLAASSSNLLVDGPPPPPPSSGPQQRREAQPPLNLKPVRTPIPKDTMSHKSQSKSVFEVLDEPMVCERRRPNDADQTLVLSDPNSVVYQAKEYLEYQIGTLGAEIDAFVEARRSLTQSLRTDVHKEDASHSVETRLEFLENENHRLRLLGQGLRDELDAVRISTQIREDELLDEIQSLRSYPQAVLEEPNDIYSLLDPENGEMSMELATPLLPTRAMLDVNSPHLGSLVHHLDPPSIPLPPSPRNDPTSLSPALS